MDFFMKSRLVTECNWTVCNWTYGHWNNGFLTNFAHGDFPQLCTRWPEGRLNAGISGEKQTIQVLDDHFRIETLWWLWGCHHLRTLKIPCQCGFEAFCKGLRSNKAHLVTQTLGSHLGVVSTRHFWWLRRMVYIPSFYMGRGAFWGTDNFKMNILFMPMLNWKWGTAKFHAFSILSHYLSHQN